jgi:hypothetical protein
MSEPITINGFVKWLLGFLFTSLIGIIVFLAVGINSKLNSQTDHITKLSNTMIEVTTNMKNLNLDHSKTKEMVIENQKLLNSNSTNIATLMEWKRNEEK